MKTQIMNPIKKSLPVLIACVALFFSTYAASPEGDFRMLKEKNGIDLYYRWMVMPEGNKVRQMKAILEINGGTEEVLNLLKDEKRALQWITSAEQFRNLTPVSGPEWVSYIQFAVPWPFADQDCILEYNTEQSTEDVTVINFQSNPEYIGKVDGVSRMKDITGSIVIRPRSDGSSILECYFLSKKASVIPRWITDPIITGSILSLMESLRKELTVG